MCTIFLGDQAPRNGGLLRLVAAKLESDIESRVYVRQDADAPWRQTGQPNIKAKDGWVDYWALAARFPWTLSVPGHELHGALGSLKLPRGLTYLAGPNTTSTIWKSPQVDWDRQIFQQEVSWMSKLAEMAGTTVLAKPDHEDFQSEEIMSAVETFREEPPLLLEELPPSYFWAIDQQGRRYKWDGTPNPRLTFVPVGLAIPLEASAREQELGSTSLSYLQRSLELRDRFLSGHKVSVWTIEFDWNLPFDPLEVLWTEYASKRRAVGKPADPWDPVARAAIKQYWQGRPTSVGHAMLGGELRPSFTRSCL